VLAFYATAEREPHVFAIHRPLDLQHLETSASPLRRAIAAPPTRPRKDGDWRGARSRSVV